LRAIQFNVFPFSHTDTSREPREGEVEKNGYHFLKKDEMYQDILAGKYFEWGEDKGNYYGSKLSSIRDIISAGKIAVVDCDPSVSYFRCLSSTLLHYIT